MTTAFHLSDAAAFDTLPGARGLASIVQDPPAGVRFMGAAFDSDHGGRDAWVRLHTGLFAAGRRALERGCWSLTWALPRTSFWTAIALDDAGYEITDCITHLFGQGWPKNAATCLKPASEHWWLARNGGGGALNVDACRVRRNWDERGEAWKRSGHSAKPEAEKITGAPPGQGMNLNPGGSWPTNVVMSHCPECVERGIQAVKGSAPPGRGCVDAARDPGLACDGLNGNGTRVGYASVDGTETIPAFDCLAGCDCGAVKLAPSGGAPPRCDCGAGMWWACPVAGLDAQAGNRASGARAAGVRKGLGYGGADGDGGPAIEASEGGASRFFPTFHYAAKCPSAERHAGASHLLWQRDPDAAFGWRRVDRATFDALPEGDRSTGNVHPTVKPLRLARWLTRLVTPPGGKGGDPFCGSGSIAIAAALEGFDWIGADVSPEAIEIACARLAHWTKPPAQTSLFSLEVTR